MGPRVIAVGVVIVYLILTLIVTGFRTEWKFKDVTAGYAFSWGFMGRESDESDDADEDGTTIAAAAADAAATAADAAVEAKLLAEAAGGSDAIAAAADAESSATAAAAAAADAVEATATDAADAVEATATDAEPVAYAPVGVDTYRLYKDTAFDASHRDTSTYEKISMLRNDGESAETFADRCAGECSHVPVNESQCRVFSITKDGNKCKRYQVSTKSGSKFGSFRHESEDGTHTYRHVGSTGDKECADYIARKHGDDSSFFKKGHFTPKTHYKLACRGPPTDRPSSCDKAPDVCFK